MDAVECLFLRSAESRAAWRAFLAKNLDTDFTWSTQVDLDVDGRTFRPDLVLEARGAVLIVENKITARLAQHLPTLAEGDDVAAPSNDTYSTRNGRNQLQTYGKGLASVCGGEWRGALVFLSHACPPPTDFSDGNVGAYGVPWQSVTHWCEVWRWLKRLGSVDIREDRRGAPAPSNSWAPWCALAVELADFLEENQMSAEYMTHFDLAATHVFVSSAARVNDTFNAIWRRLETSIERSRLPIVRKAGRIEIESVFSVRSDCGVIWETRYIKGSPNWWIGWGIRFPELGQLFKGASLPTETHAFVGVSYDDRPLPALGAAHKNLQPEGWIVVPETNELVAVRALSRFARCASSSRLPTG